MALKANITITPSTCIPHELESQYKTNEPILYAFGVVSIFILTVMVSLRTTWRRQQKVLSVAKRAARIVESLFPKNVQERMMEEANAQAEHDSNNKKMKGYGFRGSNNVKGNEENRKTRQIVDLFPYTTIIFTDIVGFTAWSSTREPGQVFTLLETIY
jgi:hypothetical protein